jgi:hypothetical protein
MITQGVLALVITYGVRVLMSLCYCRFLACCLLLLRVKLREHMDAVYSMTANGRRAKVVRRSESTMSVRVRVLRGTYAVHGGSLRAAFCTSMADRTGAVRLENGSLVSCKHVAYIAHALSKLAVPFSPTFAGMASASTCVPLNFWFLTHAARDEAAPSYTGEQYWHQVARGRSSLQVQESAM